MMHTTKKLNKYVHLVMKKFDEGFKKYDVY